MIGDVKRRQFTLRSMFLMVTLTSVGFALISIGLQHEELKGLIAAGALFIGLSVVQFL